ncbi:MAG: histidine kinase, partial [Defluviitaleaceae bacterium]|nr:histidine kinase [Defluviitaleaceae bacterium]
MIKYIIKLNLLLIGLMYGGVSVVIIVGLLVAITATSLNQYFDQKIFNIAITCAYIAVCLVVPVFAVFLPAFVLDVARFNRYLPAVMVLPMVLYSPVFLPVLILSYLVDFVYNNMESITKKHNALHDYNTVQKRALTAKTKELEENSDKAAHLAKLSERNRIARDIHDNIGHVLSRAILQTAALQA